MWQIARSESSGAIVRTTTTKGGGATEKEVLVPPSAVPLPAKGRPNKQYWAAVDKYRAQELWMVASNPKPKVPAAILENRMSHSEEQFFDHWQTARKHQTREHNLKGTAKTIVAALKFKKLLQASKARSEQEAEEKEQKSAGGEQTAASRLRRAVGLLANGGQAQLTQLAKSSQTRVTPAEVASTPLSDFAPASAYPRPEASGCPVPESGGGPSPTRVAAAASAPDLLTCPISPSAWSPSSSSGRAPIFPVEPAAARGLPSLEAADGTGRAVAEEEAEEPAAPLPDFAPPASASSGVASGGEGEQLPGGGEEQKDSGLALLSRTFELTEAPSGLASRDTSSTSLPGALPGYKSVTFSENPSRILVGSSSEMSLQFSEGDISWVSDLLSDNS